MTKKAKKISNQWIEQTREYFSAFLDETDFPDPDRTGERGPKFQYSEWLIMLIAVLSVKIRRNVTICSGRILKVFLAVN